MNGNDIKRYVSYNPNTGEFRSTRTGRLVGTVRRSGQVQLSIAGKFIAAHAAAWAVTHGEWADVVHIDGDKANNAILNLRLKPSDVERFTGLVRYAKADSCWEFAGALNSDGYGSFGMGGKVIGSHRAAWIFAKGKIPAGKHVLHRCDNPSCCNPNHLFLGSHIDNMRDRRAKDRIPRGECAGNAKLTEAQVREIRSASGAQRAIGRRYGISGPQVHMIRSRKSWAHVK